LEDDTALVAFDEDEALLALEEVVATLLVFGVDDTALLALEEVVATLLVFGVETATLLVFGVVGDSTDDGVETTTLLEVVV
jgi:hypothetical protein